MLWTQPWLGFLLWNWCSAEWDNYEYMYSLFEHALQPPIFISECDVLPRETWRWPFTFVVSVTLLYQQIIHKRVRNKINSIPKNGPFSDRTVNQQWYNCLSVMTSKYVLLRKIWVLMYWNLYVYVVYSHI